MFNCWSSGAICQSSDKISIELHCAADSTTHVTLKLKIRKKSKKIKESPNFLRENVISKTEIREKSKKIKEYSNSWLRNEKHCSSLDNLSKSGKKSKISKPRD